MTTVLVVGGFYVLCVLWLYVIQRRLMYFPPATAGTPEDNGLDFKEVRYTTSDGIDLFGWIAPPQKQADGTLYPVLLCFHGNASHVGSFAHKVLPYHMAGYGLFLAEYRGYAGNAGTPTETGLIADAKAALKAVKSHFTGAQVVVYGESLGSGVAVALAEQTGEVDALLLEAPFSSTLDVAKSMYWFMPVSLVMKDRFFSHERIKNISVPVLVIHGTEDRTVPYRFGKKLALANPDVAKLVTIEGAGHNNLFDHKIYEHGLKWLKTNRL